MTVPRGVREEREVGVAAWGGGEGEVVLVIGEGEDRGLPLSFTPVEGEG